MTHWLRLLVLSILLPAYGIAAAGVTTCWTSQTFGTIVLVEGHALVETSDDLSHHDPLATLVYELGDTSDDMPDHYAPTLAVLPLVLPRAELPCAASPPAPDEFRHPLLRPPMPLARA